MFTNRLAVIGNLGRDPAMRYTPAGQAVTDFSLAVNNKWKNKEGETQETTFWLRCSAWAGLAEVCNQYLKKGMKVYIEGRLTFDHQTGGPRIWQDKEGNSRASFEITVDNMTMLGSTTNGDSVTEETARPEEILAANPPESVDIPF